MLGLSVFSLTTWLCQWILPLVTVLNCMLTCPHIRQMKMLLLSVFGAKLFTDAGRAPQACNSDNVLLFDHKGHMPHQHKGP